MDSSVIVIESEDDSSDCEEVSQTNKGDGDVDEEMKCGDHILSPSNLDEDLIITFSKRAEVLPHARYDCTIYPFTETDRETTAPVGQNHLFCDQCFCFVCDKQASKCTVWSTEGRCHCNSHKRSVFWTSQRDGVVLGCLRSFNLQLSDVDAHLRQADSLLNTFRAELSLEYSLFLKGKVAPVPKQGIDQSNQGDLIHDYTRVYECVSSFLDKADEKEDSCAAIMRLGAAQDLTTHFQPPGISATWPFQACISEAKCILLQRVIDSIQRQMVMADFSTKFIHKLQTFCQRLSLPPMLKTTRNSMCLRPWDDVLLVSVLKGQNVTGFRKEKGKKDVLVEPPSVVLLRAELLQRRKRYRELARYLKVVMTDGIARIQELRDLIPLFLCKAGQFDSALSCLPSQPGPASRLKPHLFLLYLRIFSTATAPTSLPLTTSLPARPVTAEDSWEPVEGAWPLKRADLVKFALRIQRTCAAVHSDTQCWTCLLAILNKHPDSHLPLAEPSPGFLNEVKVIAMETLTNNQGFSIPRFFTSANEFQDQALLLLVTEALSQRILQFPLGPLLPVINTFKENVWCFQYLCDGLAPYPDLFHLFLCRIDWELQNTLEQQTTAGVSEGLLKMVQPMLSSLKKGLEVSVSPSLPQGQRWVP